MIISLKNGLFNEYKRNIKKDLFLNDTIRKLKTIYESELEDDYQKIFEEKFKLEYHINSLQKIDVMTMASILLSISIPTLLLLIDKSSNNIFDINILLNDIFLYYTAAFLFIKVIEIQNKSKINSQKSFYILCLKIIENIEKEIYGSQKNTSKCIEKTSTKKTTVQEDKSRAIIKVRKIKRRRNKRHP